MCHNTGRILRNDPQQLVHFRVLHYKDISECITTGRTHQSVTIQVGHIRASHCMQDTLDFHATDRTLQSVAIMVEHFKVSLYMQNTSECRTAGRTLQNVTLQVGYVGHFRMSHYIQDRYYPSECHSTRRTLQSVALQVEYYTAFRTLQNITLHVGHFRKSHYTSDSSERHAVVGSTQRIEHLGVSHCRYNTLSCHTAGRTH